MPVNTFSHAAELEAELRRKVRGEVRFDRGSRALYATDGSNYRQFPIGRVWKVKRLPGKEVGRDRSALLYPATF